VTDNFTTHLQALHRLFSDDFMRIFTDLEPKVRKQVLPYLQTIFRKWYHSTLIENIYFSPANLANTIGFHHGASPNKHMVAQVLSPATKLTEINMKVLDYNIDAHPIIGDLKYIIQFSTPHIDLCEEWCFSDSQARKVAKKLSMDDPFYATFLLDVACKMDLLHRMPSLYVQRMQISETADTVLAQPPAELFRQIVDTVIELTAIGLQNSLPMPVSMFSEEGLRNLLLEPLHTDGIFENVFGKLGYDLELLLDPMAMPDMDNFSEESEAAAEMMSGIFILGVALDRLFFTPFGSFLRIIRPIYSIPFDMKNEIAHFVGALDNDDDDLSPFFAPCTSYMLSELGLQLFGVAPTEANYFDSSMVLPPHLLNDPAFLSPFGMRLFINATRAAIPVSELPDSIYSFRVYREDDPDAWVVIQIPKVASLHFLYEEIADIFCVFDDDTYSFFHAKTESPFVEYTGNGGKRKTRKHTDIPLLDLDFEHMSHMLLAIYKEETLRFALEMLGETAPNAELRYPVTSEMSDEAKEKYGNTYDDELDDEDFDLEEFINSMRFSEFDFEDEPDDF